MINLNGVDFSYLTDEAFFIEKLARDSKGKGVTLDYWQRLFIRDKRSALAVTKSRQVGYSYIGALKGLARSHLQVDYKKYFVSYNLDEAKNKIRYAKQAYDSMPQAFKLKVITDAKTELAFEDKRGRISLLKALTSKEPRGMNGDVDLDEINFYQRAREVFHAAGALGIRGGSQMTIGSSPKTRDGIHHEVISNHQNKFAHFGVYSVPWWFCSALCNDVKGAVAEAKFMSTLQRVERFARVLPDGSCPIQEALSSYTMESFQMEYECEPMDDVAAFMPYSLIDACKEANYGKDLDEALDSDGKSGVHLLCQIFKHSHDVKKPERTESFLRELEALWAWVRKHKRGLIEIGYDVGRHRDISALILTEERDGKSEVRAILELTQLPFPVQEQLLSKAIEITDPLAARIDKNGMGEHLAENLSAKYKSKVEPVAFTNQSKAMMATGMKALFEKQGIKIPAYKTLENHIHSISRTLTGANNLVYEADASDHHGDLWWALCLAKYRGPREPREYKFVTGGPRRRKDFSHLGKDFEDHDIGSALGL
jgi:phage FluMu gp28-like protein